MKRKTIFIAITITLGLIIAGQGFYLYRQHSDLEILRSKYSLLQEDYATLQEDYNALEQRYASLESKYGSLESEFSALNSAYKTLESQLARSTAELAEAERAISNLRSQMESLRQIAEENKFMFYYASLTKQRYGVDDLEEYLDRWEWSEGAYTKDVFDCSEMSAYIE